VSVRGWVAGGVVSTVAVGGLVAPVLLLMAVSGGSTAAAAAAPSECGVAVDVSGAKVPDLDSTQLARAGTIYGIAREVFGPEGLAEKAALVGLVTAMQEATLLNKASRANPGSLAFPHDAVAPGDHDSVGIFQQRDAWGPLAVRMDVAQSARMFYTGGRAGQPGLDDIDGWQDMPLATAAQRVQRSAFPLAYAKWEPMATRVVERLSGAPVTSVCEPPPDRGVVAPGDVGVMLGYARSLVGVPYVWGGTTESGVDCSGLLYYAWRKAGHPMRVRTAQQMYANSDPIAPGQEQGGDIIFSSFDGDGAGHMIVVIRPGWAVEAPRTGLYVRERAYEVRGDMRIGRLRGSAFSGGQP